MDPRHLREATRAEHEATEALMPLNGPELTRELYVATLQTLLPVIAGWEAWAAEAAPRALAPMLPDRRRSHLLAADLEVLGAEGRRPEAPGVNWAVVVCGSAEAQRAMGGPEFEAAFLGAMYVMEGSTLGGRFLARHLEDVLGLVPGQGDAYLQGHGEATGSMWREVTAHLAAVPEPLSPWILGAARRAFAAFGAALQTGLSAPIPE